MEGNVKFPRMIRRVRAVLIDSFLAFLVLVSWWFGLSFIEPYPAVVKVAYPLTAWLLLDPVLVTRLGTTPGHYIMNLQVQDATTGQRIGFVRAILRSVFKTFTGWWSFIFVLATRRHQALHDVVTRTVVVLREPGVVPAHEQLNERSLDTAKYRYPSKRRRAIIIVSYILVLFIILTVLTGLMLSEDCIEADSCKSLDTLILFSVSVLWFGSVATIIVCGWRSMLMGARRGQIV